MEPLTGILLFVGFMAFMAYIGRGLNDQID